MTGPAPSPEPESQGPAGQGQVAPLLTEMDSESTHGRVFPFPLVLAECGSIDLAFPLASA